MIKPSVKETKWSSLLARNSALILYISIWIFDFGPVKLPGLSRNGPQAMVIDIVSKMTIPRWARHFYLAILMCAYFTILKFRGFVRILYFESVQFLVVDSGRILEVGTLQKMGKNRGRGEHVQIHTYWHDFFYLFTGSAFQYDLLQIANCDSFRKSWV